MKSSPLLAAALAACTADPSVTGRDATVVDATEVADAGFIERPHCRPDLQHQVSGPSVEAIVDREVRPTVLELINNATKCVDVYQFEFVRSGSVQDVRDSLNEAARRGVAVRVFLDEAVSASARSVEVLRAAGIDAKLDGVSVRTHLKIVAADGASFLIGSTNFSGAAFDFNHETNLLIREPSATTFVMDYLEQLWDEPGSRPSVNVGSSTIATVWLDGGHASLVLPVLSSASTQIDMMIYGVNFDERSPNTAVYPLVVGLGDAAERGVGVRLLLEKSRDSGLNEINERTRDYLVARGVDVRFDSEAIVSHAKLIIVDDTAFVGTNNWGYGGLERDHEAGVRTRETAAVSELKQYFETRFAEGQ